MNELSRKDGDPPALLGPGDPPAFEVIEAADEDAAPVLVICDHASPATPASLGDMGLAASDFERHIAYDIGAGPLARRLAAGLGVGAVLAGYSRLVIDLNRPPGHPESVPEESDGTPISTNRGLGNAAQAERVRCLFDPYHEAVAEGLARLWRRGRAPALFSVHSFSPDYGDTARPWDVGVLWNRDPRLAMPLMEGLRGMGLNVGDNVPYSGLESAYTIDLHGGAAGLANCVVEINQNQVRDDAGVARWSEILTGVLGAVLDEQGLYEVRMY